MGQIQTNDVKTNGMTKLCQHVETVNDFQVKIFRVKVHDTSFSNIASLNTEEEKLEQKERTPLSVYGKLFRKRKRKNREKKRVKKKERKKQN